MRVPSKSETSFDTAQKTASSSCWSTGARFHQRRDRTWEPVEGLLDDANIYLRTAIKTYLRTAVEDDPSLAQHLVRLGSKLKKQPKATKQQRKKKK